jgi:hypothetical protein
VVARSRRDALRPFAASVGGRTALGSRALPGGEWLRLRRHADGAIARTRRTSAGTPRFEPGPSVE